MQILGCEIRLVLQSLVGHLPAHRYQIHNHKLGSHNFSSRDKMDNFTNRLDALEASSIINETIVSVLLHGSAITLTSGMTTSVMNSMAKSVASVNLVTSSSTIFSDKGKATLNILTKNSSGDAIVNISGHGLLQNLKSQQPQLFSDAVGGSVCTEVQSHLPGVGGVPTATAVAQGHQIASVGGVALAIPHASLLSTLQTSSVSQQLNLPRSSISHQGHPQQASCSCVSASLSTLPPMASQHQSSFAQVNPGVTSPGMMAATLASTCGTKGLQGETSLQDLRQSASLQQQIDETLAMLASGTTPSPSGNLLSVIARKVCSGRGDAEATVKVVVKWPQD